MTSRSFRAAALAAVPTLAGWSLPAPAGAQPPTINGPKARQAAPFVFYLNYDGISLTAPPIGGYEDARQNTSTACAETIEPFGEGAKKQASIQATRADWEQFNVEIVTERPATGSYTMNVVGRSSCGADGSGIAVVDCGNANGNNVSFSFVDADTDHSAEYIAAVTSQELAHTLGLDHVDGPMAIMSPGGGTDGDRRFVDECRPLTGNTCAAQHATHCPDGGQNSVQELLAIVGPSQADVAPPTVQWTTPSDGDRFEQPASIVLEASATDDVGVTEVDVQLDGEPLDMPRTTAP